MAVGGQEADLVFTGGKIRTPAHPSGFVQALAVRDGVIRPSAPMTTSGN